MKWKLRESNGMKLCTCDMFAELQFNLFFGPQTIILEPIKLDCPYFKYKKF